MTLEEKIAAERAAAADLAATKDLAARMISAAAERQQREIATIKERSIPVRL